MAGGAFGAGKSVMLLNIASELVEQGARIWWLDAYQLQDAIDYLAQSDAASMPDVLAIDDVSTGTRVSTSTSVDSAC